MFSGKFVNSIVTPIGIDISKYKNISAEQNNRIVSIGRLTKWKKYNSHMVDVVYFLKAKNIIIKYDAYGDGDQQPYLIEKVEKYDISDQVTFHPNIPYSQFQDIIDNSLMFIGAGTALIEASACGIPSLIGIENEEEPLTYGFLHDTKGFSYQEQQLDFKKSKIEDYIVNLKEIDIESYKEECLKAQRRAKDFSIKTTIQDFIKMLDTAKSHDFRLNTFELKLIVLSMFVNKMISPNTNYSRRL
ncbi:MAG: glycosyltransferase [Pedobacter sp.]|nr:MAG: glycosyltransferase [Pedobacter sp.]